MAIKNIFFSEYTLTINKEAERKIFLNGTKNNTAVALNITTDILFSLDFEMLKDYFQMSNQAPLSFNSD